jgi:hypothetical protein
LFQPASDVQQDCARRVPCDKEVTVRRVIVALTTALGLAVAAAPAQAAASITADPGCVASITDGFKAHVTGLAPGQAFQLYVSSPLVIGLTDSNGLEFADATGSYDSGTLWTDLGVFADYFPQGGTYTMGLSLYDWNPDFGWYDYNGVDIGTGRFQVASDCGAPPPPPADVTPPTITIPSPSDGATYLLGQPATAGYACVDPESTVTSCSGPIASGATLDTTKPGPATFTVGATSAGGSASATDRYAVVYSWSGVDRPFVDGGSVRYGRNLPLRFSLSSYGGQSVSTAAASLWNGATKLGSFAYDPTSARYTLGFDTGALPGAGAYSLSVHLDDGTQHVLHLALR